MARLEQGMRLLEVELTNRCNAQCTFCPRDQTPDQGFITPEAFEKTVDRALELPVAPKIHAAGQGEPTLHPQLPEFARHVKSRGLDFGFTTNASLLTEALAEELIDAGISHITFSVSDMGDDYEEIYALSYDVTRANLMRFLDINEKHGKPVRTQMSFVRHDVNRGKMRKYRKFWSEAGVDEFVQYDQRNRGGACELGLYFVGNDGFREEAELILSDNNLQRTCIVPFVMLFVGWSGQHYLCCSDYRKLSPLGSVFDYSFAEMDAIKESQFCGRNVADACRDCDLDVVNTVREVLFEVDAGEAPATKLDELIVEMQKREEEFSTLEPVK